jgi:CheY-like chemotaxis protein
MSENGPPRRLAGWRALLVEDDPQLAALFQAVLESQGCIVVGCADSVAAALDMAEADPPPDVAVLDLKLGSALAWPVIARLSDRGVPLVVVSGYSGIFVTDAASGPPILSKPISPDFLIEAVVAALAGKIKV